MVSCPKSIVLFCATGAFSGYVPVMPGTVGSAAAIPLYCLFALFPFPLYLAATALFIVFSILISGCAEKHFGRKDPPCVVIDEWAGFLVTMASFTPSWQSVLGGFVLFRFFDVVKPYPAGTINDTVGGGAGIVLDDVAAGIYANAVLQVVRLLFA